ncbi:MAG: hypothetical protein EHM28_00765 [Spirochaetaceae bacterium]|nr:MAG: hypothetical protein EHM28_00765 [Spirochaetaceae bacterium]
MKLVINVLILFLLPFVLFAELVPGFRDIEITKGMPESPGAMTNFSVVVLNAAKINRDVLSVWIRNFTGDSVIAYAGPGVKFSVEVKDNLVLIKAGASGKVNGVLTAPGQAMNAAPHLVLPLAIKGDRPLVPEIDRSSQGLYVIRGTCLIQAESHDPEILPVESAAHQALKYLIQELAKQDGVARKSGTIYLLRHSVVSIENSFAAIDVEIAVDFDKR